MLTVTLSDGVEERITREAARRRIDVQTLAMSLIDRALPPAVPADHSATVALLERWEQEDRELRTDDPVELDRREREHRDFLRAIDRHAAEKVETD